MATSETTTSEAVTSETAETTTSEAVTSETATSEPVTSEPAKVEIPQLELLDAGKCPVCNQPFSDPRTLPCVHTVCLKCLESLSGNEETPSCPVCKKEFPLPSGGLGGLPVNVFAQRRGLSDKLKTIEQAIKSSPNTCEKCSATTATTTDGETKIARSYCAECEQKLCENCAVDHREELSSRFHLLIALGDGVKAPADQVEELETRCERHADEYLRMYCYECVEATCMKCFAEDHQTHRCSEISTVDRELRSETKKELEELGQYAGEHHDFAGELDVEQDNATRQVDELEKKIQEHAEETKRQIDREKETLLKKLNLGKKWKMDKIDKMKEQWERHIKSVNFVRSYLNELHTAGTATDVSVQRRSLRHTAEELLEFDCGYALNMLRPVTVAFVPSTLLGESDDNVVGEIEMKIDKEADEQHPTDMDTDESMSEDARLDVTTCTICAESYTDPRNLPCFHTFCRGCLESLIVTDDDDENTTSSIKCPLCTRQFQIPLDIADPDELPRNEFVVKLLRVDEFKSETVKKLVVCRWCSDVDREDEEAEMRLAVAYCADCEEKLCEVCAEEHQRGDDTHHHVCRRLGEVESSHEPMQLLEASCRQHAGQSVYLFCYDCSAVMCMQCLDQSHKRHRCTEVGKVERKFRDEIASGVEELAGKKEVCREKVGEWREATDAVTEEIARAEVEIEEQSDQMRRRVDEDENQILNELNSKYQERTAQIDGVIDELRRHVIMVETLKKYVEELRNNGSDVDIARDADAVQRSGVELLKFAYRDDSLMNMALIDLTFIPSNILKPLAGTGKNTMGSVDIEWTADIWETQYSQSQSSTTGRSKYRKEQPSATRCWVCQDTCTDPRSLPCLHTFCLKCLVKLHEERADDLRQSIDCPLCKTRHPVPATGPASLPKNVFVRKLILLQELARDIDQTSLCEMCYTIREEADGSVEINIAVEYCAECKLRLCRGCKLVHGKSKGNRSHIVHKLERSNDDSDEVIPDYCLEHEGEKLTEYCQTCKVVVCSLCVGASHRNHRHSEVTRVSKELQRQITNCINSLMGEVDKCVRSIDRLEKVKEKLTRKEREVENKVRDEAEQMRCLVEQDKEILLRILHANTNRRSGNIERGIAEVEAHVALVARLMSYAGALLQFGTAVDVARQHHDVQWSKDVLLEYDLEGPPVELGTINANYTASRVLTKAERNVVGRVNEKEHVTVRAPKKETVTSPEKATTEDKRPTPRPAEKSVRAPKKERVTSQEKATTEDKRPTSRPAEVIRPEKSDSPRMVPSGPRLTRTVSDDVRPIRGLAALGNTLVVLRTPTKGNIDMYDLTTFERQGFLVTGLGDVSFGLASCSTNSSFYVSDFRNRLVHRVVIPLGGGSVDTWRSTKWKVASSPTGLSVNAVGNVIVTYFDEIFFHEYKADGIIVRRINIQPDLVHPWHVIQLRQPGRGRDAEYVICHGESRETLNRVCIINDGGFVLLSHGERPGSGPGLLKVPMSLAVVGRKKLILVADQKNDRLLLFQPLLGSARDLLAPTKVKIEGPCSVHVEEAGNRLLVGDWSGKLFVFDDVFSLEMVEP